MKCLSALQTFSFYPHDTREAQSCHYVHFMCSEKLHTDGAWLTWDPGPRTPLNGPVLSTALDCNISSILDYVLNTLETKNFSLTESLTAGI